MSNPTEIDPRDLMGGEIIEREGRRWLVNHTAPTSTGTEVHVKQLPRVHLENRFDIPHGETITRVFTQKEGEAFYDEMGRVVKTQTKRTILWKGKLSIEWIGENSNPEINRAILNFLRDAEDPAGKVLYGEEITDNRIRVHVGLGPDHPNYPPDGNGEPVPVSLVGDNISLKGAAKESTLQVIRRLIPGVIITERDGHPHIEGRLPGDDPQKWEMLKTLLLSGFCSKIFTIQGEWNLPQVAGYVVPHPDPENLFTQIYQVIEDVTGEPVSPGQLQILPRGKETPEEGEEWKTTADDE